MSSKLGNIVANFNSQLSTKLAVGGTTASINSNTDLEGVSIPNGRYFITFDSDNSRKEHFSCVLTRTSTGADLTALKTLNRVTGAETSGALREHKIGAKVTITDFASLLKIVQILNGTETLDGSSPLNYDTQPTLSSGLQIATVQYVLDNINGGTVSFDQQIITSQTSGEALTANDIVYFKESDQKWYKADADLTATFDQLQLGLAKSTVAINTGLSVAISGPVAGFTGLTAGSKYYLSNTAGAITTTAGTNSVFIGWALSATKLLFNPVLKTLPTQKEKDALSGSTGIPSSTNKFVTQDSQSAGQTDQTQTTQNGTIEVGEADLTTKKRWTAQSFIPTKTKIRGVDLYKLADTGSFTGTVTISIQADASGSPSGTDLAVATITNSDWLLTPTGEFESIFTSEYSSLVTGSLYWIVIKTSTADTSNHANLGTNTAGGYANGSVKYNNSPDGWVAVATIDLYFKTLEGTAAESVKTTSAGKIAPTFYDTDFLGLQRVVGVVNNVTKKLYFNALIPFLESISKGTGTFSQFTNWTKSGNNVAIPPMALEVDFQSTGSDYIYMDSNFFNPGSGGGYITFGMNKEITMEWFMIMNNTPATDFTMGFGTVASNVFQNVYTTTTGDHAGFAYNASAGKMYMAIAKNGVGNTNAVVPIALNLAIWNSYKLVLKTSSIDFYINNVLVGSLSGANFGTSGNVFGFGLGRVGNAQFTVTAPTVSMLMNT